MKIGKIEKGVPVAAARRGTLGYADGILRQLEIGDSFVVEDCDEAVRSAFYRRAKALKISVISRPEAGRNEGKDKPAVYRFWRVAPRVTEAPPEAAPEDADEPK